MLGLGVGIGGLAAGMSFWSRRQKWWNSDALIDVDFAAKHYLANGVEQADETAWLSALGGVRQGAGLTFGPYVSGSAPELVTNGDFSAGTSGWSGNLSGTIAVVGGECILSGNGGNAPSVSQAVVVNPGRAYRLTARVRRISLNASLSASTLAPLSSSQNLATQTISNTASTPVVLDFGSFASLVYVGARAIYNPANGDIGLDDISLKEAHPYLGFTPQSLSGVIDAVSPAAGSAGILWQADDNATVLGEPLERNFLRLAWDAGGHLRFVVSYQTALGTVAEQANLDLGVVAPSTAFRVAFSAAAGAFRAALVGQPEKSGGGLFPGVSTMRVGRGQSGSAWNGTINRVTMFPLAKSGPEFQALAGDEHSIVAWGDSLTAGVGASVDAGRYPQAAQLLFSPIRGIANQGIGGQTSTQIAARMGAVQTLLTVSGNQIPASAAAAVTARSASPITNQGTQSLPGSLAGVPGTLLRAADDSYSFQRNVPGSAVDCPANSIFIQDFDLALNGRTCWLWPGRNNYADIATVKSDIAAMVSHLKHDRYLVGSILNGNYANEYKGQSNHAVITGLNAELATIYGPRFVDLRGALVAAADPVTDAQDIARDIVPASLRSDNIHLNDAGYAIVAAAWAAANKAMKW